MGRSVRAPLPVEVDEVRARIERWRQQRKCLGPMPEKLWAEAAELAVRFGMSPICQNMGLSYGALKTRMDKHSSQQHPAPKPHPEQALIHALPSRPGLCWRSVLRMECGWCSAFRLEVPWTWPA